MPETEIEKKSKYSSGVAKEIRRNKLWEDANRHSRDGKYVKWNEDLDRVWLELSSDVKKKLDKDEFEEIRKEFKKFDATISKIGHIVDTYQNGFKKIPKEIIDNRSKHHDALFEKEEFLRFLEEDVGKGTTWEDGDDDEF